MPFKGLIAGLGLLLGGGPAAGQVPGAAWSLATTGSLLQASGSSYVRATATDASGNVFVTGNFVGSVAFGNTLLTSAGYHDLFVAKYVPSTGTWAWAQSGGGTGSDYGYGLAVSGNNVYLTGTFNNSTTNTLNVLFGGTGPTTGTTVVRGASALTTPEMLVAKYVDQGSSATLSWVQVAGGSGYDQGTAIAVSGSAVYLVGYCTQTHPTQPTVTLGGSGTTPGTVLPANTINGGATDLLVAKYLDSGAAATVAWALAGGGGNFDACGSVALAGTSLFVGGGVGPSPYYSFGAVPTPLLNDNGDGRAIVAQLSDAGSAGTWEALASVFGGGTSITRATTTDASGNVLVAGTFTGQVVFGSTVLSSVGKSDFFVAKYIPATGTWAWAQRGGGTDDDYAYGVAASGGSVYVTGSIYSNQANDNAVTFSGASPAGRNAPQPGTSPAASHDLFVVKYADQGTNAPVGWIQVAGGYGPDGGRGIAASSQGVYVTGAISNNATNDSHVLFGRTGTVAGTQPQYGTSYMPTGELMLAKYLDQGSSATVAWTQVAGGDEEDTGYGVAVQGTSVYVTGLLTNDRTDWNHVRFGGSANILGTQLQYGATTVSRADMVLAKYVDQGPAATVAWTQVGGGQSIDYGSGVAVSGSSVYVAGTLTNNRANVQAAVFGGAGTVAGTAPQYGASPTDSYDQFIAKYTDNGATATFGWSQVGGGTRDDYANGIAAAGTGVFVVGSTLNTRGNGASVLFGGAGTALGTATQAGLGANFSNDLVVAGYTDNGPTATLAWTRIGGGSDPDYGYAAALSGTTLYAVGSITPLGTFGNLTVPRPAGSVVNVLGALSVTAMLPTVAAQLPARRLALFPNPAPGPATLSGATAGASVGIFDALSRRVATATADANGTAELPDGLPAGLYLVRAGVATVRWVVE